jgi:hypothetical protein
MRRVTIAAFWLLLAAGCRTAPPPSARAPEPPPSAPYPRFDDPDAARFDDLPVLLFFHSQAPPAGIELLRPIRARGVSPVSGGSCRAAGMAGLARLQRIAVQQGVDAVVNLRATWLGELIGDDTRFECRVHRGRYSLVWEGALARMPAPVPAAPPAASPGPPGDPDADPAVRLRRLQSLYYQGLITRDEYLERKDEILGEL